ncbi:MAG TPA: sensor histidine kinase [Cyclobacteriaceae bacterium]|nr:sensor histidine kinase [Cyclobacteriaceae bacterium]
MKCHPKVKEYAWGSLVALVGSIGAIYLMCTSCRTNYELFFWNIVFSFVAWMTLWAVNNELNEFLSKRISWIKFPIKRLVAGVVATIFCTVLAILALIKFWEFIWDITFDNYYEIVVNSLIITFFISLFFHGRSFLFEWKRSAVEAERYQKESMVATYESLKNQVNPHFLFNSLNALTNLVYEDQDKAANFIKQLSEVYRYVLDTRNKEVVSLEEELKFLKSYTYLQQIRFGDKLSIDLSLNGTSSMVAPLALQMLIENAVKHNEVSEENPLHLKVYSEGKFIVVENNLQMKSSSGELTSGVGLENIRKRYQFLSSEQVVVDQSEKNFIVKLPVIPVTN